MLVAVVATKGFVVGVSVSKTDVLATLEEVAVGTVVDWEPLVAFSDSPSIRAMITSVSSVGSSTSSVTGDALVALATVDVLTVLRLLLVGEREVGL